jgi:hypothetical protein
MAADCSNRSGLEVQIGGARRLFSRLSRQSAPGMSLMRFSISFSLRMASIRPSAGVHDRPSPSRSTARFHHRDSKSEAESA